MKKLVLVLFFILIAVVCFQVDFSSAQVSSLDEAKGQFSNLQRGAGVIPWDDPGAGLIYSVMRIVTIGFGFIGILLTVLIIYAGYLWMTAGGNSEQIEKAKKLLRNAVIGLIIIFMAYAIVSFVIPVISRAT